LKSLAVNDALSYIQESPLPLTDPRDAVPHAHRPSDIDGQCDKLVTDDRHQFITLNLHLR